MDHDQNEAALPPPVKRGLSATSVLIALNLLLYVVMGSQGNSPSHPDRDQLIRWGANSGRLTLDGQWWRLLTYQFLHAGVYALLLNMVCLAWFGSLLERMVGRAGFLSLYLVSGLCGGMLRPYWTPLAVSVGASGSVFGIVGGLLSAVAPRNAAVPQILRKEAVFVIYAFLAWNAVQACSPKDVDFAAHVGGFAGGVMCGLLLKPRATKSVTRDATRTGAVALVGLALLALFLSFPPRPDPTQELSDIQSKQLALNERASALLKSLQAGEITASEYSASMEREVLPDWTQLVHRIDKQRASAGARRPLLEDLKAAFELREEAWRLLIRSLREKSEPLQKQALLKWQAAQEATRKLNTDPPAQ